jgi:hypothetical protein
MDNLNSTIHYFKQTEENRWECSFCGEITTENPFGWVDENWKEKLKPGWRVYKDPESSSKEPLMNYQSHPDSGLNSGFIYAPFVPEDFRGE